MSMMPTTAATSAEDNWARPPALASSVLSSLPMVVVRVLQSLPVHVVHSQPEMLPPALAMVHSSK
eukprot:CAMPEP_0178401596 /NCGR_PEP_ID=MMETSP0689_2-20121128/16385_1 /TAXON_ID=160604 /ORGANISM="Amphidinium massartii, Strain CS-259" /LENGTH=64 /DNA_ID=CAMNT_0020022425 /DNA_START=265 /DNA_END=459 /DNA_ORIENTATION=-